MFKIKNISYLITIFSVVTSLQAAHRDWTFESLSGEKLQLQLPINATVADAANEARTRNMVIRIFEGSNTLPSNTALDPSLSYSFIVRNCLEELKAILLHATQMATSLSEENKNSIITKIHEIHQSRHEMGCLRIWEEGLYVLDICVTPPPIGTLLIYGATNNPQPIAMINLNQGDISTALENLAIQTP